MADSTERGNCTRSNSICASPESDLLNYVRKNDIEKLSRLLENNEGLLDYIYTSEKNLSILLIALCDSKVKTETIEILIKMGANLYYSSQHYVGWQALHFAALSTRIDILKLVIDNLKEKGDINATADGKTALHVIIKEEKLNMKQAEDCAKLLLQRGINVNLTDKKGRTAIMWAAKKSYKNIIKAILEHSRMPVDLDILDGNKETARGLIISENLYDGTLPEPKEKSIITDTDLFQMLKTGREEDFVKVNIKNVKFISEEDISELVDPTTNLTLLQISCKNELPRAVKHLLELKVDPNVTKSGGNAPIEIVAHDGRWDLFEMLLGHPDIEIPNSIFTILLKYIDSDPDNYTSKRKCFDILLEHGRNGKKDLLDVNKPDNLNNNTPLHYAVRYADREVVKKLLDLGASLGSKNDFGIMPVEDIEPDVLEQHLDGCVKLDSAKRGETKDFLVTYDYRSLVPPSNKSTKSKVDKNSVYVNIDNSNGLDAETEVIAYMSKAPELRQLLTHPVISSLLFMKWQRISLVFWLNILLYTLFFCSLVVYIFASYTNLDASDMTLLAKASKTILCLTFWYLVLRELFQMAIVPGNYVCCFENYLELVLIFYSGSILCGINILQEGKNSIDDSKMVLSAVSILLASFVLILLIGKHPKFSTNVEMLKKVSISFFTVFMWYSLLILAFALSFYILFSGNGPAPKNETTEETGEDHPFSNPGQSVFKTLVMLTGEFDTGSMDFHRFPLTSKIMFSLFIFMIAIILLNLLNGLAVSDIQMIRNDAELMGHIARAQYIRYVESIVLGNILPTKLLNVIRNCCYFPLNTSCTLSKLQFVTKRVFLFPHYLDYQLSIYAYDYGKIVVPTNPKSENYCGWCRNIYLDKSTVKNTISIVKKKKGAMK